MNRTAAAAGIPAGAVGAAWRLSVSGSRDIELSRDELLAMALATHDLPIACVEGWSTTQKWTGVPLTQLAQLVGAPRDALLHVESIQPRGAFRQTTLNPAQASDHRSLLALRVNGDDLSMDHGYPARIIVPALPGVHNTKWVKSLTFATA